MQEKLIRPLGQEDPLEEGTASHSGILPGDAHGRRSLAGCSPQLGAAAATKQWQAPGFMSPSL